MGSVGGVGGGDVAGGGVGGRTDGIGGGGGRSTQSKRKIAPHKTLNDRFNGIGKCQSIGGMVVGLRVQNGLFCQVRASCQ